MNLVIKKYHSPDISDLQNYRPQNSENFSFLLQVFAGPDTDGGSESFDIVVCTLNYIAESGLLTQPLLARHLMIVSNYDFAAIKKTLEDFAKSCTGADWSECAVKFSRIAQWEFEDYQE